MPAFVIRDALESDIPSCMALDHTYETDQVWQMTVAQENGWRIAFQTERRPRFEAVYPVDQRRLTLSLPTNYGFFVAATRESADIFGYLTMRYEPIHRIAWVQDIVVGREFRRERLGSRLVKVARQWAAEQGAARLMVETQTRNYPAISFCTATGFTFCGYNDRYFENQDIAVFFVQLLR